MVGKKPTSYQLRSGGSQKSHNSRVGGGAHCTEEKHSLLGEEERGGSITNQRRAAWDTGVLDLREWSPQPGPGRARALLDPTAGSRPLGAPTPSPACCSLEAGGGIPRATLPPDQARQCPPLGLRGKGGPSSGEDATPTALIALIPRSGERWGCWGRGPGAAADSGGPQVTPTCAHLGLRVGPRTDCAKPAS